MLNFEYQNPTKMVFGKGTIPQLSKLLSKDQKIMMTYGGGSIMKNGVYDQVMTALEGYNIIEFGGIEPNPLYETCMQAVEQAKAKDIDFLLSVGGGSVLDATKFIAAAIKYNNGDPWNILSRGAPVKAALPLGDVLTLPATGSEMNGNAVISRKSTQEKLAFYSPQVYPQFSILDPETTYSLPTRQLTNGLIDSFVHVIEQYLTYDVNAPLQDRQAEAVLLTLIEIAPEIMSGESDYDAYANLMWAATQALNGLIACGVPSDWATHEIGHEITALHGLDHAQTLAIVLPAVMKHQRVSKAGKLIQYGQRVWGIEGLDDEAAIDAAIEKTDSFFRKTGAPTRLSDYNLTPADCAAIPERFAKRGAKLGEHKDIRPEQVKEILALSA